jgi:hypothetical protein
MNARKLASILILFAACRDTDRTQPSTMMRAARPQDTSLSVATVIASISFDAKGLLPCGIPSAPGGWIDATLHTARARIRLPPTLSRLSRPGDTVFLDGWYTETEQVLATAYRDSMRSDTYPASPACVLQSHDGGAIVSYRTFRPRASSPDSIYGGRALFALDSATVLELQVSAIGRPRFETLLPVLASVRADSSK